MTSPAHSLTSYSVKTLKGTIRVPGDKSISHRALMFGALSVGQTRVTGLLEGEDVLRTAAAMQALGAEVKRDETPEGAVWTLHGRGLGGLCEPENVLDMGNAGTGARLLMGLLATHPLRAVLTGDGSLRKRPMARVSDPLSLFGAQFFGRQGGRLPMMVIGTGEALPVTYRLPMASAQVKSAVLLAGLNARGATTVIEPVPTRDHTELMLQHFGADLAIGQDDDGARTITLNGQPELRGADVAVPSDPSSAAFPVVAGLIVPGAEVRIQAVGLNPRRTGLFTTLHEMGADLRIENPRREAGEMVGDLIASHGPLKGIDVPADRAADMIDEYPVLAMAAACAEGTTRMRGLAELRVKESDRLTATAEGLKACGARVEVEGDDLIVIGSGKPPKGGATVSVDLDHRIAMSFLVLGMASDQPVCVDDGTAMDTSFPGFAALMNGLGADIRR